MENVGILLLVLVNQVKESQWLWIHLLKLLTFLIYLHTKEGCEFRDMPTGYTESDKMMHAEGDTKNEQK